MPVTPPATATARGETPLVDTFNPQLPMIDQYLGERNVPQDIHRRRRFVYQAMRRMGQPVIIKHMYTDEDVQDGVAEPSPNYDDVYGQTRDNDPYSHNVGYVSVEKSPNEWIDKTTGAIVVAPSNPGAPNNTANFQQAPRYRGYGPGQITYIILPDVPEDIFKLTDAGVIFRSEDATAQAPWWPDISDNDLVIAVSLRRNNKVEETYERFKVQRVQNVSERGYDRRGYKEVRHHGSQRYLVNQTFELSRLPKTDQAYQVETDR